MLFPAFISPLLQAAQAELPGGYGAALLQALLALGGVCVLAWVVLRFGARRGFGVGAGRGGRVTVLERVALDPRRSLYLVKVGERVLLLSAGDGGAPALVAELAENELPEIEVPPRARFADVIGRITQQREVDDAE